MCNKINYDRICYWNRLNIEHPTLATARKVDVEYDKSKDAIILIGERTRIPVSIKEVIIQVRNGTLYVTNITDIKAQILKFIRRNNGRINRREE